MQSAPALAPQLVEFAREARLNDSFVAALAPLSAMTSPVLMALLALLMSSQVPPPLTNAEAALPPLLPPMPLAGIATALAAAVSVVAFLYVRLAGRSRCGQDPLVSCRTWRTQQFRAVDGTFDGR